MAGATSPRAGTTDTDCPDSGTRQPSVVMRVPENPSEGAGNRVTAKTGPLHEKVAPSHSVTSMRQSQLPVPSAVSAPVAVR